VIGNASLVFIPAHGLEIALISKFVSRQYLDNTSKESRSLAPYFTEDVRLIYTFPQRLVKQALARAPERVEGGRGDASYPAHNWKDRLPAALHPVR
jgi:hypothetical protein